MHVPLSRSMPEHPESFPVNALVPIAGTPLEKNDVRTQRFIYSNPLSNSRISPYRSISSSVPLLQHASSCLLRSLDLQPEETLCPNLNRQCVLWPVQTLSSQANKCLQHHVSKRDINTV